MIRIYFARREFLVRLALEGIAVINSNQADSFVPVPVSNLQQHACHGVTRSIETWMGRKLWPAQVVYFVAVRDKVSRCRVNILLAFQF